MKKKSKKKKQLERGYKKKIRTFKARKAYDSLLGFSEPYSTIFLGKKQEKKKR